MEVFVGENSTCHANEFRFCYLSKVGSEVCGGSIGNGVEQRNPSVHVSPVSESRIQRMPGWVG